MNICLLVERIAQSAIVASDELLNRVRIAFPFVNVATDQRAFSRFSCTYEDISDFGCLSDTTSNVDESILVKDRC